MRMRVLSLATMLAGAATMSCSSANRARYEVTLGSNFGQLVRVYGCPGCHPFTNLSPGVAMTWQADRSLPRTYSVEVRGRRIRCPALHEEAGADKARVSLAYTVTAQGQCVRSHP
jgi:hypothetical protein